jgi:tRNA threonylcarbamoyladenosine biosynthesis protein TsaE
MKQLSTVNCQLSIEITSLRELPLVAKEVLDRSGRSGVVAFYGPMGAGKTTLIKEICAQSGVVDPVTSPTFALVNHYLTDGGESIFHFDFYRIAEPEEAFDLGYEEYFYGGALCLVEWPEKIETLLPEDTLRVRIAPTGDEGRVVSIDN